MTTDKKKKTEKDTNTAAIKGQIVLTGTIELLSPMLIGSGNNDNSDIDILVDNAGKPFIPATSFVGVLKNHLNPILESNVSIKDDWHQFWGYSKGENSLQSILCCSDLLPEEIKGISVREGVSISREKGMAISGGKFDFEIAERKTQFKLKLKAFYSKENEEFIKKVFETTKDEMEHEKVRVGAKTQNGLGKIKLFAPKLYEYKFSEKLDVIKYFKDEPTDTFYPKGKFEVKRKEFVIDAYFDIKTSLISRAYSTDPKEPDATHIKSLDDFIMPGTGLKGAVSSRAEKILRTKTNDKKAIKLYEDLFGFVKRKNELKSPDDPAAKKSRVRIEECVLDNNKLSAEQQNRIKIDRFTGGTISAALFDSMPLFRKDKSSPEKIVKIKMSIQDPKDFEVGLLLLVLKDLWTGDLPIGGEKNVGRGVLEGVKAIITDGNGLNLTVTNPEQLSEEDRQKLKKYVTALNEEVLK